MRVLINVGEKVFHTRDANSGESRLAKLLRLWTGQHEMSYGQQYTFRKCPVPIEFRLLGMTRFHHGYNVHGHEGLELHCWMRSSGNYAAIIHRQVYEHVWEWLLFVNSQRNDIPQGVHEVFDGLHWSADNGGYFYKIEEDEGETNVARCLSYESKRTDLSPFAI